MRREPNGRIGNKKRTKAIRRERIKEKIRIKGEGKRRERIKEMEKRTEIIKGKRIRRIIEIMRSDLIGIEIGFSRR
jgi:hypothetical protein